MWNCASCGNENFGGRDFCWKCSVPKGESKVVIKPEEPEHKVLAPITSGHSDSKRVVKKRTSYNFETSPPAIGHLRGLAIVCLIAGIVSCIYWLFHLQQTFSGEYLPYTRQYLSDKKVFDPLALGFAIASVVEGVVAYVLFSAVASIWESVIELRKQVADNSTS